MCPWGRRFVNGEGGLTENARMVCHCLLIEGAEGLILVYTGFGSGDVNNPGQLGRPFNFIVRPQLELCETALQQIRALGFDPGDVRHIVATHLDIDHAGGLPDFPEAEVHLLPSERKAAENPSRRERARYPAPHIAHGPRWAEHEPGGDQWLGFESIRILPGSGGEILLIPLPGHTLGHTGVAIRRADGWLLHCGDAYFHRREIEDPPSCPPGLRVFQKLAETDAGLRQQNRERLRELARRHSDEVELICAHDGVTLDRYQAAAAH